MAAVCYRDRDGREVDLVFDVDGTLWPVEIKHAATARREWMAPFTALERLKNQWERAPWCV